MTKRYSNRSAQISYQRCPRLAYLTQFYPNDQGKPRGLAKKGMPFQMVTGIYVHRGVESLLINLMEQVKPSIEDAVSLALSDYDNEIVGNDELMDYGCSLNQLYVEQRCLIGGLLRGWFVERLPYFAENYEVIEVEKDHSSLLVENYEIDEEVYQEFKIDAVLKHKETGLIYLLSNKTTGAMDGRKLSDARSDIQGLSEAWGAEKELGLKVHGVIMEYLITGRKEIEEQKDGSKEWVQWNPLIRGWKQFTLSGEEYAWRYAWDKMEGGSGRLGKGWSRFHVKDYEGGVKQWVSDLRDGKFFPSFGKYENPLNQQFVSIEYYRNSEDAKEWLESIQEQELKVGESILHVNSLNGEEFNSALRKHFPMYRHSCNYPVKCQMFEICHGSAGLDPFMNGFEFRKPHHKMQMEDVND